MWKNNGLSIVLFALFLLCLAGQSVSGWKEYNEEQAAHGRPEASWSRYVTTADFGESVFENWESEFLQMGMYVILTVFLFQRGSAESKDPDKREKVDERPEDHRNAKDAPWPVRRGGFWLAIYKCSLSLALFALFFISFLAHARTGAAMFNEEQLEHGTPTDYTTLEYMTTPQFWFESMQNWQSEFLAVFAIVVLSVWLRQWGSPESKPVHTPHRQTAE